MVRMVEVLRIKVMHQPMIVIWETGKMMGGLSVLLKKNHSLSELITLLLHSLMMQESGEVHKMTGLVTGLIPVQKKHLLKEKAKPCL